VIVELARATCESFKKPKNCRFLPPFVLVLPHTRERHPRLMPLGILSRSLSWRLSIVREKLSRTYFDYGYAHYRRKEREYIRLYHQQKQYTLVLYNYFDCLLAPVCLKKRSLRYTSIFYYRITSTNRERVVWTSLSSAEQEHTNSHLFTRYKTLSLA
jgi:hypothetical protein